MINSKIHSVLTTVILLLSLQLVAQNTVTISPSGGSSVSNIPEMIMSSLYNSDANDVTGYISFDISSNGTAVIQGTTPNITITAQTTFNIDQINVDQVVLPLTYSFIESSVSSMVNNGNNLPDGNYNVCIEFISSGSPVSNELCNFKFIGTNTTGGSLYLITPFDNSETATLTPLFTWVGLGEDILYEIKITEVLPYQISNPGISINNPAFHFADGLTSFNYLYSSFSNAPAMEECKYYEWQVTAYTETTVPGEGGGTSQNIIATSDVYRFGSECSYLNRGFISSINYMTLSKIPNSYPYTTVNNGNSTSIAFKYVEKYAVPNAVIYISNLTNPDSGYVYIDTLNQLDSLQFGPNYISTITVGDLATDKFSNNDVLLLCVQNTRGELWRAKFKLIESE